ncbi:MAG: ABC transporter permease [Bacteroidota bacterium]
MKPTTSPPKWPLQLLKLVLKEDFLEEIEGDMEEVFYDNCEQYSLAKARKLYIWDTLKLVRPSLAKNFNSSSNYNNYLMLKTNFKVSMRVLKRNKIYTVINVLGMSVGLAIALLIMLYAKFELSYEDYNPLAERMVRITIDYLDGETVVEQDCETYPPLAPRMNTDFSEVADFTRAYHIDDITVRIDKEAYRESRIYAVDGSFFTLFHYPFLFGDQRNVFAKPYEVVLTETLAKKYFNKTDVVGESILISGIETPFQIKGIIEDSPANTHLKFDVLVSFPTMFAAFGDKEDNWNGNNTFAYLLLGDKAEYASFLANLTNFNEQLHKEEKLENEKVIAQPMKDIHLYSDKSFEPEKNGDATSVFFLLGVAILIIVIAIVNYINLSTSRSLDRAKEVGVRKVLGSSLTQLRIQFLTESLLINFFAGFCATILIMLSLNEFTNMAGLPTNLTLFTDPFFWGVLLSIILLSSFLSGVFPAFILSSFRPVAVLKGKFSQSGKGVLLRKSLVVFQFTITVFLLVQTLTADQQLKYMKAKDLGLNIERTIVVRSPKEEILNKNYLTFKKELLNHTQFQSVALSSCVPGLPSHQMSTTTGIQLTEALEEHNYNFYLYWIDEHFLSTMQMELKAGKDFIEGSKNEQQVIVNEEAIRLWGIPSPEAAIGKEIDFWGKQATIIGVLKNFHQASAKSAHIPMIFLYDKGFNELASIRTTPGNVKERLALVESIYKATFPNTPFNYFFLDQEYDKQYRADEQFQQVFSSLTGFAILIACLGLFGLVTFTIAKRKKEIGIRKVLGAKIWQIIVLLSKDFVSLVGISMVIATPLTFFIIRSWLERYAYRIDMSIWLFVIPIITVLLISIFTILLKTLQISNMNPVASLKDE